MVNSWSGFVSMGIKRTFHKLKNRLDSWLQKNESVHSSPWRLLCELTGIDVAIRKSVLVCNYCLQKQSWWGYVSCHRRCGT
jgi:hypothetical protein